MTGSPAVPARLTWAVELLDVGADDRIVEIGCGPGLAAALVAERLRAGHLTAIDRSATALQRTLARNAHHVDAGRLSLHQCEVRDLREHSQRFDKAFAVNVNVFWTTAAEAECRTLAKLLRPGGELLLVYEQPPGSRRDIASLARANLERHRFTTDIVHHPAGALVCITGRCTTDSGGGRDLRI